MAWQEDLRKAADGKKMLILGVGNEMKGDDGLGKYVCDRIKTENKLFCGEMPENFISRIKESKAEVVLIIDAMDFQGKPGSIMFAGIGNLDAQSLSTHSMSLEIMAKMLDGMEIYLLGVQPKSLEFGEEMSEEAKHGAGEIINELNKMSI